MAQPNKTNATVTPAVPQLPSPPLNYDQNQQSQLNNSLRLYLQQLNTAVEVNANSIAGSIPTIADFTGTGSQTAFTLSTSPTNLYATNVFINGVYQNKNSYSISGTTLTFTQAPPYTSVIEVSYA